MPKSKLELKAPVDEKSLKKLKAGEAVLVSGKVYAARDSAHKAFGDQPPFEIKGAIIFYASPTPARKGQIIGSIGPTTATRMDAFTPPLLKKGLKVMIGKGNRGAEVVEAIKKYKAVYLAVPGGAAAGLSKYVKSAKVVAYPELGPEALLELEFHKLPAVVAIDTRGQNIFELGPKKYAKK